VAAGEMHENVYLTDVVPVEELESRALGVAKRCSERPEFLTRATVAALRRAASDLLPIHGSDIDTLVLSEFDQQASARQAAYISRHVVPSSSSS
jgi:enoyl-CoA hydratase/carnithine racemase